VHDPPTECVTIGGRVMRDASLMGSATSLRVSRSVPRLSILYPEIDAKASRLDGNVNEILPS